MFRTPCPNRRRHGRTCRRSASPARSRISRSCAEGRDAAQGEIRPPTSVSLFDQGLIQVLQASVTGLEPKQPYVLALARQAGRQADRWSRSPPS